nr:MAG TPA: hypothetical protein [Bacteriophage sp.]
MVFDASFSSAKNSLTLQLIAFAIRSNVPTVGLRLIFWLSVTLEIPIFFATSSIV